MKRLIGFFIMFMLYSSTGNSYGNSTGKGPVKIPGMTIVKASVKEAAPEWAITQRLLIKTMEDAVTLFTDHVTQRGGTLYGRGDWDDVFEMFYNWSLFYAVGADEKVLNSALEEYNALIRQCTYRDNQQGKSFFYKEFPKSDDWFHITEGLMSFYDLAVGDPTITENIDRAKRFAGFFMNEDPECTKNYDPVHKLFPYISSGSKGPLDNFDAEYNSDHASLYPSDHEATIEYIINYGHASLYPKVRKEEFKSGWEKDPNRLKEISKIYNNIVNRGDVPINLGAVGLMTNAYLYTGDEKYKKWVLEYVDAWIERIKLNKGILPDNIGQSGKIGEYRNGQWWGGFFGWTGTFGNHMIFGALTLASECAHLVSGDPKYLSLLRSQIDVLLNNSKTTKEGQLVVPYKYGPDGWYSYRPMRIFDLAHLWNESMDPEDWKRIEKVMNGNKYYPLGYSGRWGLNMYDKKDTLPFVPTEPFNWNYVPSVVDRDIDFPTEYPRIAYYAGKNPDWPLKIMEAEYKQAVNKMGFMRNNPQNISEGTNPVITKGLIQVTMGAPQTVYNGGLLRARVRYFDIDRARPGLPPDVAALVEKLEDKLTVVRLVNLSVADTHRLIIQAGAFGEHEFLDVKYQEVTGGSNRNKSIEKKTILVNNKFFEVELPPSSTITLEMGMRRFANKPTYAFPWQSTSISETK